MVHEKYSVEKIIDLMDEHPDAEFIAHPECEKPVLLVAKFIGSTTALLNYASKSSSKKFIVGGGININMLVKPQHGHIVHHLRSNSRPA